MPRQSAFRWVFGGTIRISLKSCCRRPWHAASEAAHQVGFGSPVGRSLRRERYCRKEAKRHADHERAAESSSCHLALPVGLMLNPEGERCQRSDN
jgi:hypothetical protein